MRGESYTKDQLAFMEKHGADMSTTELTDALNNAFYTNHTPESVRTTLKRIGIKKSKETRSRIYAMNSKPIGSENIIGGYRYIKVRKSSGGFFKDWEREICIVYKSVHGDIPKGYMVVTLNGDKLDARPENLALISKKVAARMANGHGKSFWSNSADITKAGIAVCELDQALSDVGK